MFILLSLFDWSLSFAFFFFSLRSVSLLKFLTPPEVKRALKGKPERYLYISHSSLFKLSLSFPFFILSHVLLLKFLTPPGVKRVLEGKPARCLYILLSRHGVLRLPWLPFISHHGHSCSPLITFRLREHCQERPKSVFYIFFICHCLEGLPGVSCIASPQRVMVFSHHLTGRPSGVCLVDYHVASPSLQDDVMFLRLPRVVLTNVFFSLVCLIPAVCVLFFPLHQVT